MNKLASIAIVTMRIFLMYAENPSEGFHPLDVQTAEKNDSGQILAIEDVQSVIADLFYLGYLSQGKGGKYFYDMASRKLQTGR